MNFNSFNAKLYRDFYMVFKMPTTFGKYVLKSIFMYTIYLFISILGSYAYFGNYLTITEILFSYCGILLGSWLFYSIIKLIRNFKTNIDWDN